MALSDDERRVLEEMERQLRASTSDVVEIGTPRRINATAVIVGVLVILAGVVVLLGGISAQFPLIGVAGFGLMVIGVFVATTRRGNGGSIPSAPTRPTAPKPQRRSTFEERWDRRMDGEL